MKVNSDADGRCVRIGGEHARIPVSWDLGVEIRDHPGTGNGERNDCDETEVLGFSGALSKVVWQLGDPKLMSVETMGDELVMEMMCRRCCPSQGQNRSSSE